MHTTLAIVWAFSGACPECMQQRCLYRVRVSCLFDFELPRLYMVRMSSVCVCVCVCVHALISMQLLRRTMHCR